MAQQADGGDRPRFARHQPAKPAVAYRSAVGRRESTAERMPVTTAFPKEHPGVVEIALRFSRYVGPRFIAGSVVLHFSTASSFSFTSEVQWPADNYEMAVREGVEDVLRRRLTGADSVAVVLKSIEWDDVASCALGFRQAAVAAAEAAFVV